WACLRENPDLGPGSDGRRRRLPNDLQPGRQARRPVPSAHLRSRGSRRPPRTHLRTDTTGKTCRRARRAGTEPGCRWPWHCGAVGVVVRAARRRRGHAGAGVVSEKERLHTSVLLAPTSERRRARKERRQAAVRIATAKRTAEQEEAKRKLAIERAERKATGLLPAAGEPGPAALRTPGRIPLPKHPDPPATLAPQYPYPAEGGPGSNRVFIGQDLFSRASFVYDPWVPYQAGVITAPNMVLAGIVGSGKSSLAKSLYTRSLPFGRRVYVPGDP